MVVLAGFVIARMATRTGGRVTGRRPIHGIRVGVVAVGAVKITSMIERFVRQAGVAEARWRPTIWGVALTTIHRGTKVSRVHAGGIRAVVAGRTGAQHLVVVHGGHR